jgi:putative copper export protein
MTPIIKLIYLVALSVWTGAIVFFSAVVAPTLHKTLKPADASELTRKLFPKYYLTGILCAAVGIVCVGILTFDRAFGKWPGVLSLLLLAALGATSFWLRQTVVPAMDALREKRATDPEADAEWKTLHRQSVQLNIGVLIGLLALLFLTVFSRVV